MQTAEITTTPLNPKFTEKKKSNFIPNTLLIPFVFITSVLTSPKWMIAIAPWLFYTVMLRFFRQNKWKQALFIGWGVTYVASLISVYKVIPMPLLFLFVFSLVQTGSMLIPYSLDKWLTTRINGFLATLVFPSAMVLMDFIAAQGGGGTWGNVAYLQFHNPYLMQLASVTGIWGISFMIYWFASCANYLFENPKETKSTLLAYGIPFLLIMGFGFGRLQLANSTTPKKVKVAGITTGTLALLETIYECETGEKITIPAKSFQGDSELANAFSSMAAYVKDPFHPKFEPVEKITNGLISHLYTESERAIQNGAKIISWSEGIVGVIKSKENTYIQAAQTFAKKHQIWLFFPMAAILPGEVIPGEPFIENKVLTINPQGEIVNTYFKNIPVGGVEPCFPGDGTIPVFDTELGNISPVICYDADFPQLLKQTGQQATELLVVPSGDWYDIAHIHSYMAATRGIENGVSVLRTVSNGLSIATDNYGQILAKDYFFEDDNHLMMAEMPMQQVDTVYASIGDVLVYICMGSLLFLIIKGIFNLF